MTSRFLAAAGPEDALQCLQREIDSSSDGSLVKAFDNRLLKVWTVPGTPVLGTEDGSAVLVGRLFDRPSGAPMASLPGADAATRIADRQWGPYVHVAMDGPGHSVLRDPSGAVPVYYGSQQGVAIYASDPALLELAWAGPFDPDLDFIRHWLTFPFLRGWRTGAIGVRELLPGMCRQVTPDGEKLIEAWSPYDHAADDPLETFDEAASRLREEALRTISRLALDGGRIAVQLSGGLDSSIVATALSNAGVGFRAITFATRAADGDERRYAREVARRCGVELVEVAEDFGPPSFEIGPTSPFRPPPNPMLQPLHRALSVRLALLGTDTILDGAGGDSVFAFLNTGSPAIDALRRLRPTAAIRALRDIAEVHGSTFWAAVRSAARRVRRGTASRWPRDTSFLAAGAAVETPDAHFWLSAPRGVLPGTADQVRMIVGIHHFLSDSAPAVPTTFHPLLAQPMLELCLRISSWLWFAGGRDRAVVRAAFKGLVPDVVLERRRKASLESMMVKGYMASRPRLETFLREGGLAAAGIIDAEAVGAYLRRSAQPRDLGYVRLLEIAAAEQWHRSFGG